jgi:hypothetical protein
LEENSKRDVDTVDENADADWSPDADTYMDVDRDVDVDSYEDVDGNADVTKLDEEWKPEVGAVFDSFEEAESKIKRWAIDSGFQVRRGHSKSGKENLRTYKTLRTCR